MSAPQPPRAAGGPLRYLAAAAALGGLALACWMIWFWAPCEACRAAGEPGRLDGPAIPGSR